MISVEQTLSVIRVHPYLTQTPSRVVPGPAPTRRWSFRGSRHIPQSTQRGGLVLHRDLYWSPWLATLWTLVEGFEEIFEREREGGQHHHRRRNRGLASTMGKPGLSDHDVGLESGGETSSKTRIGVVGSNDEAMIGQGGQGGGHGDHRGVDMDVDNGQASRPEEKEETSHTGGHVTADGNKGHGSSSLGGGQEAGGSGQGSLTSQGCVLPREKLSEHADVDVKGGGKGKEEPAKEAIEGGGAFDEPNALAQKQKPNDDGHGSLDVGQGSDTMKMTIASNSTATEKVSVSHSNGSSSRAIHRNRGGSLLPAKRPAPTAYRYKCLVCNVDLRVDLPEGTGSFRCIECRAVYVVVNTDGREEALAHDADWPMPAPDKRDRREGGHGEGVQKDAPRQAARHTSSPSHGPRKSSTKPGRGTAEHASSADVGDVPRQPKELSGYLQFMKDNVIRVKNENPTWPHRDAFRHASLMVGHPPLLAPFPPSISAHMRPSINQSINRSINQSINQSVNSLLPPFSPSLPPSILLSLPSSLSQLKLLLHLSSAQSSVPACSQK